MGIEQDEHLNETTKDVQNEHLVLTFSPLPDNELGELTKTTKKALGEENIDYCCLIFNLKTTQLWKCCFLSKSNKGVHHEGITKYLQNT